MNLLEIGNIIDRYQEVLELDVKGLRAILNRELTNEEMDILKNILTYDLEENPRSYMAMIQKLRNIVEENMDDNYMVRMEPLLKDPAYAAWQEKTEEIGKKILPIILPYLDEVVDEEEDL